jgi:4,5-dihydroxyphthalate decarboxylase
MHVIVMSKKLKQEHPELADKVYQAFEEAKRIAYSEILSDMAGFTVVNLRERMKEQLAGWGDPWKHGFKANGKTLETFNRYNFEQGLTRSNLTPEAMFVESTLET